MAHTPWRLVCLSGNVVAAAILLVHSARTSCREEPPEARVRARGDIVAAQQMVMGFLTEKNKLPEAARHEAEWSGAAEAVEQRDISRERDRASARDTGVSRSAAIRRAAAQALERRTEKRGGAREAGEKDLCTGAESDPAVSSEGEQRMGGGRDVPKLFEEGSPSPSPP